jgi:DNA-binding CsgD family transcriptional regulator
MERSSLTPRQLEILAAAAAGQANSEIAYRLGCSGHTVNAHWRQILGRLHARTRTHAVAIAYELGLLPRAEAG